MVLVVIFIVAVIMYRIVVSMAMFESKTLRSQASLIASLSAAVVNLIIIMALGRLYEKLALSLTHWGRQDTINNFDECEKILYALDTLVIIVVSFGPLNLNAHRQ